MEALGRAHHPLLGLGLALLRQGGGGQVLRPVDRLSFSGKGSDYRGKITDLSNGKTYTGKARVDGNSMKLSGCVLGVLCRTVSATRR